MPKVFKPDGRFLTQLGRPGDGPGEFRAAALVAGDASDTLFIADYAGRLSVFSPELKFIRSAPFPSSARGLTVLKDGTILSNAMIADRETVGLPFHLFRRDGYRFKAIGDGSRPFLRPSDIRFVHRIAPAAAGGFWAAPLFGEEYRIERWTLRGERDIYLRRTPGWFVPLPALLSGVDVSSIDPRPTAISGLWEDSEGFVWVVLHVADPRRTTAPIKTLRTPEGDFPVPADPDLSWDSIVEVIDPSRRALVASQRFDEVLSRPMGNGRIGADRERPDGSWVVRVLQLRLARGK
jgi:hypothetical protein